jgi:hypothetical protein
MRMLLPPPEKAHPALGPMYHERPTLRKEKSFVRFSDFFAPQRGEARAAHWGARRASRSVRLRADRR